MMKARERNPIMTSSKGKRENLRMDKKRKLMMVVEQDSERCRC